MKPARPSSAVILIREIKKKIEVFLGQRHKGGTFPSAFVFPGGVLSTEDSLVTSQCNEQNQDAINKLLSVKSDGLKYYSAAIRELFEETGVLLALKSDGKWVSEKTNNFYQQLKKNQKELSSGQMLWSEFVTSSKIILATNKLYYLGHWETPISLKARFTTRFFLAELPPNQKAHHDGDELVDSKWLEPIKALDFHNNGKIELPFPHMKHLETLADFSTPESLRNWALNRARGPIKKVRPWITDEGGKRKFILPWESDYPDNA
tara:strand:- start:10414 stop:11202 length:789 start_codon:yes stop_codon:yes gene_type:complete